MSKIKTIDLLRAWLTFSVIYSAITILTVTMGWESYEQTTTAPREVLETFTDMGLLFLLGYVNSEKE